jgi:hypothetical protein
MACRAATATTDAEAAMAACFDATDGAAAQLVPMSTLKAGDVVTTLDTVTGWATLTRVVLNQHTKGDAWARLLKIKTVNGATLTVTPDHVIFVDGAFVAASSAAVGASLSAGTIAEIIETRGAVINPVTVAGTILAADVASPTRGVLASTATDWIAARLLEAPTFPFVATRLLSYLVPETTQAAYDAAEPAILTVLPLLTATTSAAPAAVVFAGVAFADVGFALGVAAYSLVLPLALIGMAGLVAARKH